MADVLRWSQLGIDIADGDPVKAAFIAGSPLALAMVFRGYSRALLGLPGWREDFDDALAMAHDHDLLTFASVVVYKYAPVIRQGLLVLDDAAFGEIGGSISGCRLSSVTTTRWDSPSTAWAPRCWSRAPTSNAECRC